MNDGKQAFGVTSGHVFHEQPRERSSSDAVDTETLAPARGFTLIELLIAVAITAAAMVVISGSFLSTLRARTEIENLGESMVDAQRILTLVERDLRGLWHHNIKRNKVFVGRNLDIGGYDADRIDFLTTTDSVGGTLDTMDRIAFPSICEVGYWLKENRDIPGLLELWRREDPLVDDDVLTQGRFQLVCDRIKSFNISYYETLGARAEELFEWDSSHKATLPRRIKIEFTVHRRVANRNESSSVEVEDFEKILQTYTRHIVFDPRFVEILKPGIAMVPIAPPRPEAAGGGGGGGGGGAPGAGAGGPGEGEGAKPGDVVVTQGSRSTSTAVRGDGADGFAGRRPGGPGRPGGAGGQPPGGAIPGLPPGVTPPTNIPIDLGELLRNGGLRGGGGSSIFGGLGGGGGGR